MQPGVRLRSRLHSTVALLAGSAALASCGSILATKPLRLDEAYVFKGVQKLVPNPDGSWIVKWDAVPSAGVTYQVYAAPQGKPYDFTSPVKTTSETNFESDDLRFADSTCFAVRYTRGGKQDDNAKSACTRHRKIHFTGLSDFRANPDGTFTMSWMKLGGTGLAFRLLEGATRTAVLQDPATTATLAAGTATFTTKALPFGEPKCYRLQLLKGSQVIAPLYVTEVNTPCVPEVNLGDYRGVETVRRTAQGEAKVTWSPVPDARVGGYVVRDLSVLDPKTKLPAEYVVKDPKASEVTLTGIDDSVEHQFEVRVFDLTGLRDGNARAVTLAPRNDDAPIAGVPTRLAFFAQPPANVTSDVTFATLPQVEVTDAKGVRVVSWQDAAPAGIHRRRVLEPGLHRAHDPRPALEGHGRRGDLEWNQSDHGASDLLPEGDRQRRFERVL